MKKICNIITLCILKQMKIYPLIIGIKRQCREESTWRPTCSVDRSYLFCSETWADQQQTPNSKSFKSFWYQLRKMVPTYPGTDDFRRDDNWLKLFSSVVSLLYISCCYSSTVITFAGLPEHWIIFCNRRSHDFNCLNSTVNKGDTRRQL